MNSLNKEILRLSIPSILANVTVPLVGMVDIAVAGHLTGPDGIGAAAFIGGISIGSLLFDLLYWNFGFLRMSTGGLVAQAFGAGDMKECARVFSRAVILSLLLSVLILAIQVPFTKLAFLVVQCSPEVKSLALKYFFIRIWAAPATLSLMAFRGWFLGMQDSVSSMVTDLVVNAVNIVSSIFLSIGFGSFEGLGFAGVAYGTVIAQYAGLFYATLAVTFKYRRKVFSFLDAGDVRSSLKGRELTKFLSMNTDLFVRSLCFIVIYLGYTIISARYGDLMLSASTIMMKLLMLFSYFIDGFAFAGEALTGRFIGEKSFERTKAGVKYIFAWSVSVVLLFIVIYVLCGVPLLRLMTSDEAVVEASRQFIPWLVLMPLFGCPAFTWDGIYFGATASKDIRNTMVSSAVAFFAVWFIGKAVLDASALAGTDGYAAAAIHLLMGAYFTHLLVRTVIMTVRYRKAVLKRWFN